MSGCSGNCSSCGESCSDRKPESLLAEPNKKSNVKKVIAVVSGKGVHPQSLWPARADRGQ